MRYLEVAMAKRAVPRPAALRPADVSRLGVDASDIRPLGRFLLGLLQSRGYDYDRERGPRSGPRSRVKRPSIKEFALQHGLPYQTLWKAVTGKATETPRDDFTVAACKALGLRKREEIFLGLLLAHQEKTPAEYRYLYDAFIQDLARMTGLDVVLG